MLGFGTWAIWPCGILNSRRPNWFFVELKPAERTPSQAERVRVPTSVGRVRDAGVARTGVGVKSIGVLGAAPLTLGSESMERRANVPGRVPDAGLASVKRRPGLLPSPGEVKASRLVEVGWRPADIGAAVLYPAAARVGSEAMRALKKVDLKVPPALTPALPAVVGLTLVPVCDWASTPSFTLMNIESAGSGRAWSLRATLSALPRCCGFFNVPSKVVFVVGLAGVSTLAFLHGVDGSAESLCIPLLSSGVGGTTFSGLSDAFV